MYDEKILKYVSENDIYEAKKIKDEAVLPSKTLTILGNDKIFKYNVLEEGIAI